MQTARAITVSEANGRAGAYLAALSTNLIALAFIGQMSRLGTAFYAFALILLRFAPETVWMLPGLWQILIGLGLFASLRFLPRSVAIAGAWYFLAGAAVLMLASETRALSSWAMGVPFGVGQLLLAAILHLALGGHDAEGR